ncbi:hypothetical protein [Hippea sp. KM1]|uniref:hypothetical protein n=1 Tax=Hippea sp. KM1 TaxID=944481 RepID=UPI00046CC520|nr:hypothetical protein [Hippea sp. KM1]
MGVTHKKVERAKIYLSSLVPFFYTKFYRYYQGRKIFAYILGELIPVVMFLYLYSHIDYKKFLLLWLFFWSIYEIGYFINDCVSVKKENISSIRVENQFCKHLNIILIFRVIVVLLLLWNLYKIVPILKLLVISFFLMSVFYVHNKLVDYSYRFLTLVLLGVLKPMFILYFFDVDISKYIFIIFPTLIVKYLDYLFAKKISSLDIRNSRKHNFWLFTGWGFILVFIDLKMVFIFLPIYTQYNKIFIYQKVKNAF